MSRLFYYLPVLGYHRIGARGPVHVPTVSEQAFERQLTLLARWRYRVLSMAEAAECLDRGARWPRRSAVITFDDGYQETYTLAWPLLKRFGFPAIVFLTPTEVGRPGFLTWEEVERMSQDNVLIGSHTMHHSYLPLVQEHRLMEELEGSKRLIEERIARPVEFISYPVGGFTPRVQELVRQAGYRAACTTNRTRSGHAVDRFAIRRIKMTDRDANPFIFRTKLTGYYDAFRRLEQSG